LILHTPHLTIALFHLPLGQTEGFMNSLARIMKVDITIPNFSSLSKRSIKLPRHTLTKAMEPGSLVIVDSTGFPGGFESAT
jgi:Transposase DDE domain